MGLQVDYPSPPGVAAGTGSGAVPVQETPSNPVSATAAANTAVVITIAAVAGQTIRLTHLSWSYSAAPTAGAISVVSNAVTQFQLDDPTLTDVPVPLPPGGLIMPLGFAVVITLAAGGAAVIGKLNAGWISGP